VNTWIQPHLTLLPPEARNAALVFGFGQSPFGECLVAEIQGAICHLAFGSNRECATAELRSLWPKAQLHRDDNAMSVLARQLFDGSARQPILCSASGTEFQMRVWNALLKIPFGTLTTYQALAIEIGNPAAARAIGAAVGSNRIGWLIPCHRVVPKTGGLGGYRWGAEIKRAMLDWEASETSRTGA